MEEDFCQCLKECEDKPDDRKIRQGAGTKRLKAKDSPEQRFLVVRGMEKGRSTAVAARNSYFEGVRRECFVLQDGGADPRSGKMWFKRIMFATLKARANFFDTGSIDDDEIGIIRAHMHPGCARKSNREHGAVYKSFFDRLAEGIMQYKSRVLCLDASMALICVAPELRARGVMVSMAALFPCKVGDHMVLDSLGIFIIGKAECIRMAYSPTALGGKEPELQPQDKRKERLVTNESGIETSRQPHPILTFPIDKGPGHPIDCYLPNEPGQRAMWFQYSCTPLHSCHDETFKAVLNEKKFARPRPVWRQD